MATKITSVLANSGEDFIDELSSLIVYKEGNEIFKKIRDSIGIKEDSILDEAIDGALTTLQFGLMNVVIITVTEYAVTKSVIILGTIFTYIKGRRIIKNIVSSASNIVGKFGPAGFVASKAIDSVSNVLVANQTETLAMANMANSTSNNIISAIGQERNNQILIKGQKLNRIDNTKKNIFNTRNQSRQKNMDLYIHKFETGTWQDTKQDKKLYFDCTGQDSKSIPFTSTFVSKLNSYSNYVKTAQGEIYSNARATMDLLTKSGTRL
jgi:hypothetical protein